MAIPKKRMRLPSMAYQQPERILPYTALMQVAAEDTHDNYVICRGLDTRINAFIDYEEGNTEKPGILVAKPYGERGNYPYQVGEIHQAFLPVMRTGQNPGKGEDTVGYPADLDEAVVFLRADAEEGQSESETLFVNWMLAASKQPLIYLAETPAGGIAAMSGDTPGSATCTLKYIDEDGDIQTALDEDDAARTETIYNVASSAVDGSTIIQAKQESISGKLLVDFEDCG